MGIANVHVTGQYHEVRILNGTAPYYAFNSSGAINRSDGYSVQFNPPSDERLKTNIAPTDTDALSKIMALEVVKFNWIEETPAPEPTHSIAETKIGKAGAHVPIGFIAQRVGVVIPEAETVTNVMSRDASVPSDLHGVDVGSMIPYLVRAIQQQQAQINELKALLGGKS
jgi:hypothetical protein